MTTLKDYHAQIFIDCLNIGTLSLMSVYLSMFYFTFGTSTFIYLFIWEKQFSPPYHMLNYSQNDCALPVNSIYKTESASSYKKHSKKAEPWTCLLGLNYMHIVSPSFTVLVCSAVQLTAHLDAQTSRV